MGMQLGEISEVPQSIDDLYVLKTLMNRGKRYKHMLKYISTCIYDPEAFIQCSILFLNFLLKNGQFLLSQKMHINDLIELYKKGQDSLDFYFVKLGIKLVTLELYEAALKLAIEMKSNHLLNTIAIFARAQRNISVLGLVNYVKEQWHPGSSNINLVKSMEQISNFTKKNLKKEDLDNIYKGIVTSLAKKLFYP